MTRRPIDRARIVFKFSEGASGELPLSESERQLQAQYHRMAGSDSPELRHAGLVKLKMAAEDAASHQLSRLQNAKAGFGSGKERAADRRPDWDRWQARANELHGMNPKLSKSAICKLIAAENGLDVSGRGVANRVKIVGKERARSNK